VSIISQQLIADQLNFGEIRQLTSKAFLSHIPRMLDQLVFSGFSDSTAI